MLYTLQASVLDLRGETITSTLDLRDAFHRLCFCPEEDQTQAEQCPEGKSKSPKSPTKQSSDTDTSDEEQVTPVLRTSEEERHYWTICGSALATQIALSHSRAQANPTVERGPSHKVRIRSYLKIQLRINLHKLQKRTRKQSDL